MLKAKFRDHVRSKTDIAMKNEVLCKVLCHNICCLIQAIYELGIQPTFLANPKEEIAAAPALVSLPVPMPEPTVPDQAWAEEQADNAPTFSAVVSGFVA